MIHTMSNRLASGLDNTDRVRKRHVASLKRGLRLGKDRAGELYVPLIRAHMHAAVVAHHEALNRALLGMEAGVDRDQPPARLERICCRPQHAGCEIVVQVVEDTDRYGNIGRGKRIAGKIVDVIADELAAGPMHAPSALDVGFVAVEADVARRLRQAAQQRARSTAYVEYAITAAGSDHLVRESL